MFVQKQRVFLVNGFSFEGFGNIFVDFGVNDWLQRRSLEIILNMDSEINTVHVLKDINQIAHYFISVLGRVIKILKNTVSNRKFSLEL
jgi:hypothetical protein